MKRPEIDFGTRYDGKPRKRPRYGCSATERILFWSREDDETGCWVWTGAVNNKGYPFTTVEGTAGRHRTAHRASYEAFVAPIPEGFTVDHLCYQPLCVNPDHLEAVTFRVNIQRAWARRRAVKAAGLRAAA